MKITSVVVEINSNRQTLRFMKNKISPERYNLGVNTLTKIKL